VPTLQMLRRSDDEIRQRAKRLAGAIGEKAVGATVTTTGGFSQMGSGSLPLQNLATTLVAIRPENGGAEAMAKRLRLCETPVFTRIQSGQVLLDPRTLQDGDDAIIAQAVTDVLSVGG